MTPAEQLFEAIRSLPEPDRLRLVERVIHELADEVSQRREAVAPPSAASVIGMWESDAAAVDEMVEGMMAEREKRVLRSA